MTSNKDDFLTQEAISRWKPKYLSFSSPAKLISKMSTTILREIATVKNKMLSLKVFHREVYD